MELEKIRNNFIEEWQAACFPQHSLTPISCVNLIKVITTFQDAFSLVTKTETEAWVAEFRQKTEQLSSLLKAQEDKFKVPIDEIQNQTNTKSPSDVTSETITQVIKEKSED